MLRPGVLVSLGGMFDQAEDMVVRDVVSCSLLASYSRPAARSMLRCSEEHEGVSLGARAMRSSPRVMKLAAKYKAAMRDLSAVRKTLKQTKASLATAEVSPWPLERLPGLSVEPASTVVFACGLPPWRSPSKGGDPGYAGVPPDRVAGVSRGYAQGQV